MKHLMRIERNPIQIMKNILYGYAVCRKYGLKFKPFSSVKVARLAYEWIIRHECCNFVHYKHLFNITITVSPLCNRFKDSFLHEVGHFVYIKRSLGTSADSKITKYSLYEEYQASKFAVRAGADIQFLRQALNSYCKHFVKYHLDEVVRSSKYFYIQRGEE